MAEQNLAFIALSWGISVSHLKLGVRMSMLVGGGVSDAITIY